MAAQSKKTVCLEGLRRQILTLALPPGAALDESSIASDYGLSRPPLREVLRQLAGEGYVELQDNRGARVTPMDPSTLRSFFLAAPMIYSAIAHLAAENATEPQIMRLKDTQTLFRAAIRDGDTVQRALLNERFHAIMGEMADNPFLAPSLRRLLIDHTRISMTFYNPRVAKLAEARSTAADQHDDFITLIEARDSVGCAALALAHWDLSRSEIESFAAPQSLTIPLRPIPGSLNMKGT